MELQTRIRLSGGTVMIFVTGLSKSSQTVLMIASMTTKAKTIMVEEKDEVNRGVTGPVAVKILHTLKSYLKKSRQKTRQIK